MPKSSSTVHLEKSTWDEIKRYQEENGGLSRNEAIERMLLERRLLLKLNLSIEKKEDHEEQKYDGNLSSQTVKSLFLNMPD